MFNLDPFSRPVAIIEILILLILAAFFGYLLSRLFYNRRIQDLQLALTEQENALTDCRQKKRLTESQTAINRIYKTVEAPAEEETALRQIAARAPELNFDRIGYATLAKADDLKDILGIGPVYERKLNSLGIFTFRQLANCTDEDVRKISDIIEFFPDRVEREDWVSQARELHAKKYGRPV